MIKGKRVTLRAIERQDLPNFVTWFNDPDVARHVRPFILMTLDDETEWYDSQRKNQSIQNFSIVVNDTEFTCVQNTRVRRQKNKNNYFYPSNFDIIGSGNLPPGR